LINARIQQTLIEKSTILKKGIEPARNNQGAVISPVDTLAEALKLIDDVLNTL
jgi:hypothetical protein